VSVRGIQVHGESRTGARAGERVAVNVSGVEVEEVPRGALAASPGAFREARRLDVEMRLLPGMPALKHGARVRLHQGTAEALARVSLPGQEMEVAAGETAHLRLRLESPAVVTRGDRFILRTYSPLVTIGGGVVLDPDPPRGIRTARAAARVVAMSRRADAEDDRKAALREMAAGAGVAGASLEALTARLGGSAGAVRLAAEALHVEQDVLLAGNWVTHRGALAAPTAAMLDGVAGFHRAQPLAPGMPIEEARVRWFSAAPGAVFDRVVAALVEQGRVVARDTLALASHRVSLSPQEAAVHDELDRRLRDAALSPPDSSSLGAEMGCPQPVVDRVLQLLVKQKRIVRLDTLVFHQDALDRLKSEIAAMKTRAPDGRATVDVKAFKDTYQVSRKYAIPLLEYLDRERVTRRAGDVRIVL
jgi:selenocysteine-specific elongation factor